MDTEELEGYDPKHGCDGCKYDDDYYPPECNGCRCKGNLYFNTVKEEEKYKLLPIKFIPLVEPEVSFGTTKILKKRR